METLYDNGFIEGEIPDIYEILGVNKEEYLEEKDILVEKLTTKQYKEFLKKFQDVFNRLSKELQEKIKKSAWKYTRIEVFQGMEALIANLNVMHSRAGAQVPFTSLNFGTETSKEGRLVIEMLLKAYEKGLGNGEQPIFPNLIFKIKEGISWLGDKNEDLLRLAVRVTAKRLFPNFLFLDCTLNKDFPTDVPVMGCRTRISWDVHLPKDKQTVEGRGNASFSTINNVQLAIESKYFIEHTPVIAEIFNAIKKEYGIKIPKVFKDIKSIETFFVELDKLISIAFEQLKDRLLNQQGNFTKADFPFLMNGIWIDSENLKNNDKVLELIKHGTLGLGFIGLAETLKCLVGVHHGEDENADLLGLEIIKFMRNRCDKQTEIDNLNYGLLASPAEGLTGKFASHLQKKYGIIEGVTDKDWLTNSMHVPVEYECSVFHKIKVEGKYHKYCNAGNISYVEVAESPIGNEDALITILKKMKEADMSFVALNFPVDRCRDCGYIGNIGEKCICGSSNISRPARITGYLAETNNFNYAKQKEKLNRVKHIRL